MKKKRIAMSLILAVLMISPSVFISSTAADDGIHNITAIEANNMLENNPEIIILDVRNQSEYDLGHLCNAQLAPLFDLENKIDIWTNPPTTPNGTLNVRPNVNDTVIIYCLSGNRSATASEMLIQHGYRFVYNMLGGINAWMAEGYPIATTHHDITFIVPDNSHDTNVDIEPALKTYCGCGQSQANGICSVNSSLFNITKSQLQVNENQTTKNMQIEFNGTTSDVQFNETLIKTYNELTDTYNRTVTFKLVTSEDGNESDSFYSLNEYMEYENSFNMTISTLLFPLDANTFNKSFTYISFIPVGASRTESTEKIETNSTIKFSQLFESLSDIAGNLSNEYGNSDEMYLHKFQQRYANISTECNFLSSFVTTELSNYNKDILKSGSIIIDDSWWCLLCEIALAAAAGGSCAPVVVCTGGLAAELCVAITEWGLGEAGYHYVCYETAHCDAEPTPYHYHCFNPVVTLYGSSAYTYPTWTCWLNQDDSFNSAQTVFAGVSGDSVYIHTDFWAQGYDSDYGDYIHGQISICGNSFSGINSDLYIYVSADDSTWTPIGGQTFYYNNGNYYWQSYGYITTCFTYMYIITYYNGHSNALHLTHVWVTP